MQYAKFINEKQIEFAQKNKGSISNYNLSPELMMKDGYKPFVVIEQPTKDKPRIRYRETDEQIEQYAEELSVADKNEAIRQQRQFRFVSEADPLKMDYDEAVARGEDSEEIKTAWLAKKDEIRADLPYIEEEIVSEEESEIEEETETEKE